MSSNETLLPDLRFSDVKTFLAVRRCGSITAAARELRVTPSQVSKAIARLEAQLKVRLLARSARGVTLSEAAERVTPHFEEVVSRLRLVALRDADESPELAIAGSSYLLHAFLPEIARVQPQYRMRTVQLAPAMIRSFATHSLFDIALANDIDRLPTTWSGEQVGHLRKALFASPELAAALGPGPVPVDKLREHPFIVPTYVQNDHYIPIEDGCPLHVSERKVGHEVQVISLGLELAAATHQLVFGPYISARGFLESGRLVEVSVEGWNVMEPLYLACSVDRVAAKVNRAIVAALRTSLERETESRAA